MRAKQIIHLLIAAMIALPTFGGVLQAQSSADCAGKSGVSAGTSEETLESGGVTRSYRVYVPPGYNPTQATPLVISLHGFGGNPRQQQRDSGWDDIAESENFIAVYPAGTGSPLRWNSGQREIAGLQMQNRGLLGQFLSGFFESVPTDDVAFIHNLIAQLSEQLCVDAARIYVNGMSNGGGMTNRLACQLSDEIAAAGMVAGAYTDFPGGCQPARPVPVIAFHGTGDSIVPYEGAAQTRFPPIEIWAADWAARDQCSPTPETIADMVGDVSGVRYLGCAGNAEVDFYTISDGGHTWPGGRMGLEFLTGKTTQDIDASETMWAFFQAHPMPS